MIDLNYTLVKSRMEDLQAVAQRERLAKEAKEQNKQFGWFSSWFKPKKVLVCELQLATQAE